MGFALRQEVVLETEECCKFGMMFAMPAAVRQRRLEDGGSFWCPNGHEQHFSKSEVQRLREKLDEQTRAATRQAYRALAAEVAERRAKAELKRVNRRVSAGVCPCCNRTFQNLARHMKTKHSEPTK